MKVWRPRVLQCTSPGPLKLGPLKDIAMPELFYRRTGGGLQGVDLKPPGFPSLREPVGDAVVVYSGRPHLKMPGTCGLQHAQQTG